MDRKKILTLLFALLMMMLIAPEMQRQFGIFSLDPLQGDYIPAERSEFTIESFFSGSFQSKTEQVLEEKVGFRPLMVRIRNQWDFLVHNKAHAEGVIIGKDGMIFEEDYILEYTGRLFIGQETIDKKLERVRFVQDTLRKKGIDLVIVFLPGKASFFPDLIPNRYNPQRRSLSNYQYFIERCTTLSITHLDLNRWYVSLRDKTDFPLFTQYGTHWSYYGMCHAADTLVRFISQLRGIEMPEMGWNYVEPSTEPRDTDFDGGKSMNLLWQPRLEAMGYPALWFGTDKNKHRPHVLVVGDSYYWNIFNTGLPRHLFANEAFWYYNKMVYPDSYYNETTVAQLDMQREVEQQEVILVMITERFLYTAFWHFTDNLYRIYKPGYREDRLYNIANEIRRNRAWFGDVIDKAAERGITIEEMVNLDAEYMFVNDFNRIENKTPYDYYLYYELLIRRNPEWLAAVQNKAMEQNIALEEMIRRDAIWMYEHDILGMHR